MKPQFERFGTSAKAFLAGILVGLALYLISLLVLPSVGNFVREPVLSKPGLVLKDPLLMALSIFANNALVISIAALSPVALALIGGKRELKEISWLPDWLQFTLPPVVYYAIPIVIMLENGAVFGFLLSESVAKAGTHGGLTFFKLVAPHGMVEIPAIMGAGGLGLTLARRPVELLREGNAEKTVEVSKECIESRETGKAFFFLLVLLAIGAVIEAFFTPTLA